MTSLTRGPLPPRVYWRRRALLVVAAVLLVFALARGLSAGSDATSGPDAATPVAAVPTSTVTVTPSATPIDPQRAEGKKKKRREPVLVAPTGPCADEDIAVTPTVPRPIAGRNVLVVLELRTISAEACTWEASPETLTLKITSGKDDIWSSRQCPRAVPSRSVVVRSAVATKIGVTWSARRSDDECSTLTHWALPGFYHVTAAALAGEPADVQFELEAPARAVITRSPTPKQDPKTDPETDPEKVQPAQGKKTPTGRR